MIETYKMITEKYDKAVPTLKLIYSERNRAGS